ncbi:MAG: efflux RND transporter periplasmic adaptor subunit [Cytophaga sp.]|uniref:efflux RND transporter periplasmic adaptor subunit n=1 Tax=Cytophaga sp. TaxID=29535 RepID=UPI003F7EAAB4
MKKIKPYILTTIGIGILIAIKLVFFPLQKAGGANSGKDKKSPVPVTVCVVGDDAFQDHIYASGTIVANEEAALKVEASGVITYLNLPEGQRVKAGTLLLKVNDADLQAQLEKINIRLRLAEQSEARQRQLLKKSGVSQEEYDIALADLKSLKTDSAYHRALLAKTEIHAPFDGVIGIRNVSVGSYLTPAVTVAYIHQLDPVKIEFSLPEKYTNMFNAGDVISFRTEGAASTYTATIIVKDPMVDAGSRSVRYRALSRNPDGRLLPGAFTHVELLLNHKTGSLFVPTETIIPFLTGKKVYVVKNGIAEDRIVETGLRTADNVQVLSGLTAGDSVVVKGNFQLKKNTPVKITQGKKTN